MTLTRTLLFGAAMTLMSVGGARAEGAANAKASSEGKGSIDKEVIRRVVRAHIGQVRRCYETALAQKPELRGRVTVNWRIEPDGKVSHATVQSSTLQHEPTEKCIVEAISTWVFPKPIGGWVGITYPFTLLDSAGKSGDAESAEKPNKADPLNSR